MKCFNVLKISIQTKDSNKTKGKETWTKLPPLAPTAKSKTTTSPNPAVVTTSHEIFKTSAVLFGERLNQLRLENKMQDATKSDLRKQTMQMYQQKYANGQTAYENAKRILNDVNTFKAKSWVQQMHLASQMAKTNVLKRIRQQPFLEQHQQATLLNQLKNTSELFSTD